MSQGLNHVFQIKDILKKNQSCLWVIHNEALAIEALALAKFVLGDSEVLYFPAWDTLPYDRISPLPQIMGQRLYTLSRILKNPSNTLVISTPSALMQKLPPQDIVQTSFNSIKIGDCFSMQDLSHNLLNLGYRRVECVREQAEFSIRGGLFDVSIPQINQESEGFRLDFFGDTIENIRTFDLSSQRTIINITDSISFGAASEIRLNQKNIENFRTKYRNLVHKTKTEEDPLYINISQGLTYPGMEHWLPLFYDHTTLFTDYLPESWAVVEDPLSKLHWQHKVTQYQEHYISRLEYLKTTQKSGILPYFPVDVCDMIETNAFNWKNVYQTESKEHGFLPSSIDDAIQNTTPIKLITLSSKGSIERLKLILNDKGISSFKEVENFSDLKLGINLTNLPISKGFLHKDIAIITEEDLFGEKLSMSKKSTSKRAKEVLMEASSLAPGDLVVHDDHGIGRFLGLQTIPVLQTPHDCICLEYSNGDKLYVPIENINILTRYGSDNASAELDRLGSASWQLRKAKAKDRIKEIAHHLISMEATRQTKKGRIYHKTAEYDLFEATFPYVETQDQEKAIQDILEDLSSGKPMDRLICGDVGYGKTEIAIRASFLIAHEGAQVAVIAPTTLLCRQHFKNFHERLAPFGIKVKQLSRLVSTKEANQTYSDLENGDVNVIVATHALLKDKIKFKDLGLVVIDEEQHFGVAQKEKLKTLANDVHLLTLSATPIPRTLHMALSGLRSMSIIATPPVDRMAIRTFITPFDPVVIKEALLREHYRGGQSFYVCPRIEDIEEVRLMLAEMVPTLKVFAAHGQMNPKDLDEIMNQFCEGQAHILLATNIIESGIDLSSVNTIIIHRSHLFGLSQLYQLRGRVGRSKVRAYAYLTTPNLKKNEALSETSLKRLEIMGTLDSLGAGFRIASHDMDLRGTGNLIGSAQSGHIKEIGVELYQQLLQEAIEQGKTLEPIQEHFTPEIKADIPVYIPDTYIKDLGLRMTIYRRLGALSSFEEIEDISAEFADRFGKIPTSLNNLFSIIKLKIICKNINIEKCDIGPKGAVLSFWKNKPQNIDGVLSWVSSRQGLAKLRPDGKLILIGTWESAQKAIVTLQTLLPTIPS